MSPMNMLLHETKPGLNKIYEGSGYNLPVDLYIWNLIHLHW